MVLMPVLVKQVKNQRHSVELQSQHWERLNERISINDERLRRVDWRG